MKEKFKYVFDNKTGIFYKYYYGSITIEIELNNYHMISTYYKQHLNVFKNQKNAILTHSPKDIVFPTLVETEDDGYLSRPFYTLEAAIHWVLT